MYVALKGVIVRVYRTQGRSFRNEIYSLRRVAYAFNGQS